MLRDGQFTRSARIGAVLSFVSVIVYRRKVDRARKENAGLAFHLSWFCHFAVCLFASVLKVVIRQSSGPVGH